MNTDVQALLPREGLEPESGLEPANEKDGWTTARLTSEIRGIMTNADARLPPTSRVSTLCRRPSRCALVEPLLEPGIALIVIATTLPEPA
jgi:hypothetical protein